MRSTRPTTRTLQIACATVAAALLATGCGRSDDSADADAPTKISSGKAKGKLVMWSMGDKADKDLQGLAKKFEQQNPDVSVQITAVPWDAAHEKLTTSIAAWATPPTCR